MNGSPIINILLIMGLFTIATPILGYILRRWNLEKYLGIWATLNFIITIIYLLTLGDIKQYIVFSFQSPVSALFRLDWYSLFFIYIFLIVGFLSSIHSIGYMSEDRHLTGYYTLLQTMVLGLVGLALADDLFTFFVAWEIMAVSSYVLVGFRYHLDEPVEAAMKYLVMSGVGSLLMLYGISYVYGMVGTLEYPYVTLYIRGISQHLEGLQNILPVVAVIASLFMVGFGIKAAYFPFWTWLPDAHPAAPSPISALLSGIVIKAGILGLIKYGLPFILLQPEIYSKVLVAIAVLTMTIANILALLQPDIKRLLAYSSIVNIGFIMIGVSVASEGGVIEGVSSALTHVFSHALGKGLAFLAAGAIIYAMETREIAKMEGLGRVRPFTASALMIALFSLGGLPPLPGFWSKWFLIFSAVSVGDWLLAFTGVINSVLAIIYYIWLFQRLFLSEPTKESMEAREVDTSIKISLAIMIILMIVIGIYPDIMYIPAVKAAEALANFLPFTP